MSTLSSPNPLSPAPEDANFLPPDDFWDKHKGKILGGLVVLATIALAVVLALQWLESQKQAAMSDYARADSAEQWREIIQKYPGQPVAGNALLMLAAAERSAGQRKDAEALYADLQNEKPGYPLQALSALGLAEMTASESEITPNQAATAFQNAAAAFPNSFVAPYASYTEASLYLNAGEVESASAGFRAVATDYPSSILARLSSMQLQRVAQAAPTAALPAAEEPTAPAAPSGDAAP